MENANVHLSAEEQELVQNANVILTKNAVIEKVKTLLVKVSERLQQCFNENHPLNFGRPLLPPRVTRGEQYRGLPWVAVDYPRIFKQQGISAIRHIFWWGHHFSCTWHCSGIYHEQALPAVVQHFEQLAAQRWLVFTGADEWTHELTNAHREVAQMSKQEFERVLKQHNFFKLCKYLPLSQWNETVAFYDTCFEEIINIPV